MANGLLSEIFRLITHLLLLVFFSTSCVITPVQDDKAALTSLSTDDKAVLDEFHAELEVGRNMAGRLLQFYGNSSDLEFVKYINQVGAFLGTVSDFPERRYMFDIIDTDIINAFACPGGYILVSKGALRNAQNEAELAGVLSHEIAHVGHKHMFDKIKSMSADEVKIAIQNNDALETMPESVKARRRPVPEENKIGEAVAKYLAGGAAGLSVIKAAGAGMSVILTQGLGAEKEIEADTFGIKTAARAGYDPYSLSKFLCRIKYKSKADLGECLGGKKLKMASSKNKSGQSAETILERTHPPIEARVENLKEVLASMEAKSGQGALGRKRYLTFQKSLPKEN